MINMRDAFGRNTTTIAHLFTQEEGHWDENNEWVAGGLSRPMPIRVTPKPCGDIADGNTFGLILEALPEGERKREYMKFYGTVPMPINSFVDLHTRRFKIISDADYSAAGFYCVVGEYIGDK